MIRLIDRLVDGHLLLEAAEAQDIAADETVQAAIEQARADVLRQTLIERAVVEATTDEAVQAAYEERKAQPDFAVEQVTARHILVETAEEAEAVIEQLDGGADFAELAIEKSTDPAAATGGELGTFARGSMVPPFEAAAFAMEPGTYSTEPVQTQFGYHVILVEAKEATEPTLAEVEPELRAELTRGAIEGLLEEVRADAVIERFALDGSAVEAEAGRGGCCPVACSPELRGGRAGPTATDRMTAMTKTLPVSPLAPPDPAPPLAVRGVRCASTAAGIRYVGRPDLLLVELVRAERRWRAC